MVEASPDKSHGYEALAEVFMRIRNRRIGPDVVREWCKTLEPGATVLDLGCGSGSPITEVLVEAGLRVYGVDASPSMIRVWRERFPGLEAECAAAEESAYFGRQFDAVIAWGLLFLLPEDAQRTVIAQVAKAIRPGGRFTFTSSRAPARWKDAMTEEESVSLGEDVYREWLAAEGLAVIGNAVDEGENYYLFCEKS